MNLHYCRICNKKFNLQDAWGGINYYGDAYCSFRCSIIAKNDFFLTTSIFFYILMFIGIFFPDIMNNMLAGPSFLASVVLFPFTVYSRYYGTEKRLYERREKVRRGFIKKTNFWGNFFNIQSINLLKLTQCFFSCFLINWITIQS